MPVASHKEEVCLEPLLGTGNRELETGNWELATGSWKLETENCKTGTLIARLPPFRGGLMRHADTLGLPSVAKRLAALAAERGPRFQPAALLAKLAASGGTFTDAPRAA